MASPQLEDGYTPIANELLDAILKMPIGDMARGILWVMRQTYGWHRKEAKISAYKMYKDTGISYTQSKRIFARLKACNMISDVGPKKDYEHWIRHKNVPRHKNDPAPPCAQNRHQNVPTSPIGKQENNIVVSDGVKNDPIHRFKPPTPQQVSEYSKARGTKINGEHFCDYYTANGWMVGRHKMKDWRAAVRTWEHKNNTNGTRPKRHPSEYA